MNLKSTCMFSLNTNGTKDKDIGIDILLSSFDVVLLHETLVDLCQRYFLVQKS